MGGGRHGDQFGSALLARHALATRRFHVATLEERFAIRLFGVRLLAGGLRRILVVYVEIHTAATLALLVLLGLLLLLLQHAFGLLPSLQLLGALHQRVQRGTPEGRTMVGLDEDQHLPDITVGR